MTRFAGRKRELLRVLEAADWDRADAVELNEWWAEDCWRIRSQRQAAGIELFLTFLVDPQCDHAHTGEPPELHAVVATAQVPENKNPFDKVASISFGARKLSPQIDELTSAINRFRDDKAALSNVDAPWSTKALSPALAQELMRELGPDHALRGTRARAIARRHDCDDVLFAIEGGPAPYAVVQLTWSGKAERPGWPSFETFHSLSEWRDATAL